MSNQVYETDVEQKDHQLNVDVEDVRYETRPLPESLAGLSEDELKVMERKIVRKADFVIMPIICTLYVLNYIDRQNLSAAKLQGILTDLNMTTQQFATAIAILFVGYLPFQIPSNLIVSSIPRPGLYICGACILWGTISACTAAVHSYATLLVVRVILGMAEAVFFPGVIYLMSAWYVKREFATRIGILYIGQQMGNAFGGLIAAGVLKLNGVHGIAGWRWLFIVEGVATIGIGGISALFLPEFPYNARMLKPIERDLAVWRIEKEAGAGEGSEDTGTWAGFRAALKDPKRTGRIYPFIMGTLALSIPCYIIPMTTRNTGGLYTAMMFMPWTSVGSQLLLYKTVNNHMPRPVAKRAAAVAMLNSIGGVSNIWSSYLWYAGPHYYAAFGALTAAAIVFMITITAYKFYIIRQNKLLDGTPEQVAKATRFGITQEQVNMGWRYEGY
ncbi:uncharacterized protein IL334_007484 [Kwoniella shivajii]|uniref:Major facilitator superfamily (MFS) profile domain-containing protein n=1 Tax=Kwoniella shivajii TaxID=564305 RepID=A0ABZ1D9L2_9TREE|nr:hypothetical protein IL334_007484 [Kwoniella shivajii]